MNFLAKVLAIFTTLFVGYQMYRWLRDVIHPSCTAGTLPRTKEEMFEHNLRSYLLVSSSQAAHYTSKWIYDEYICAGLQPRPEDIKRLRELGGFKPADKEARHLISDARHEMIGFPRMLICFRWDWTLAGIIDFHCEIEAKTKEIAKRKKLTEVEATYFRRFQVLSGVQPDRHGHYGGPGFPFPDVRFQLHAPLSDHQLYFDQNYELIVHMYRPNRPGFLHQYFWERPGARQIQLYEEAQIVNA